MNRSNYENSPLIVTLSVILVLVSMSWLIYISLPRDRLMNYADTPEQLRSLIRFCQKELKGTPTVHGDSRSGWEVTCEYGDD